ncbi:MAG: hypothetical protein HYT69_00235 [Candidatus Zambryskibacteria bacterium]|nr:hypothetical protein [Candidatus Zambryskibacteria bacterium]
MKTFLAIVGVVVALLIGSVLLSRSLQKDDSTIISRSGIHWHPELEIYVNEEKIELSKNKGIERTPHSPIHTHEDLPLLHLEFGGLVREDDIKLSKWFEVWGKDFYELGSNVTMIVNGAENTEFGNYIMRDGDKIVLRYSN